MSVHFISGKPGGGKTLYAVKLIIEELLHGTRPIFTNISLNAGRLSEYLQAQYPNKQIDVLTRLVTLNDENQTPVFWTRRPGNPVIEVLTKEQWSNGQKPKYENVTDTGVFYAIDEIHNFFNARAWQETGRDVLFYLSQHRKLGDTVICVTQAITNVDKQFRSVTQDFTYLRNLNKERMGLFRLPSVFIRRTFGEPATDNSKALESGTFTLDVKGIASCYDTAQGVSIHGKGADLSERKSGLNIWVFVIGLPAILIAVVYFAPKLISAYFDPTPKVKAIVAKNEGTKKEIKSYHVATNESTKSAEPKLENESKEKPKEPVQVVAVDHLAGPWRAWLSNGEVYTPQNGLEEVTQHHVIIMGIRYRFKRVEAGPPLPPLPPPVVIPHTPQPSEDQPAVQVVYFGKRTELPPATVTPVRERFNGQQTATVAPLY